MKPIYPDIKVKLLGKDGNAFSILVRVKRAMRAADIPEHIIEEFVDEATTGGYEHFVQTVMKYVEVE